LGEVREKESKRESPWSSVKVKICHGRVPVGKKKTHKKTGCLGSPKDNFPKCRPKKNPCSEDGGGMGEMKPKKKAGGATVSNLCNKDLESSEKGPHH